ncbi:pyrimidine reductase family protein [Mycobacterium sp. URHB0021]
MSDAGGGMQLTVLGPVDAVDEDGLYALYAYPDQLHTCWVRGNMIASLDGGATDDGKAGGLAGAGDRALFALLRELADVIVVGAATVRVENYSGTQLSVAQRQARQQRGQAEVPPIAVVTRSGDLDPDARLFTRTEVPPMILTAAQAYDDTQHRLGGVAEVIDASGSQPNTVDIGTMLRILAERELFRVLTEGGPLFLGTLVEAGLLDDLCLTVAPILVGGVARRILSGPGLLHNTMRRAHVLTDDDGYLYTRYVRAE